MNLTHSCYTMYVLRPHALLIYNNLTFTKGKYLKNDNEKKKMSSSKFYGSGEQKLDALAFDLSRDYVGNFHQL